MKHKNIGSNFDDFLQDEGILAEVEKPLLRDCCKPITQLMFRRNIKVEMSRRMGTSRSALDRLLDPKNSSVSLRH